MQPWSAVLAAVRHHTPDQGLTPTQAFHAHTAGGWAAARFDDAGVLAVGHAATYAVWDTPAGLAGDRLPELYGDLPRLRRTVVDGRTVHAEENQ